MLIDLIDLNKVQGFDCLAGAFCFLKEKKKRKKKKKKKQKRKMAVQAAVNERKTT